MNFASDENFFFLSGRDKDLSAPQYLLVLSEKLTDSQLVEKFPAFYGNGRFITAFTSARHLSLS